MAGPRRAMNPKVAAIVGEMGVDTQHREKKMREERPRVDPKVAALLESEAGVSYHQADIAGSGVVREDSPLNAPGSAPMAGTQGAQKQQSAQDVAGSTPDKPTQSRGDVQVRLKSHAGGGNTLDDLSAALGKVSEAIRDIETLTQTLKRRGNDVGKHKTVLKEYLDDIDKHLEPFRQMTK